MSANWANFNESAISNFSNYLRIILGDFEKKFKKMVKKLQGWEKVPTFAAALGSKSVKERCRSGRSGRSRKPLTAYAVPGFESLSFRHEIGEVIKTDFSNLYIS